MFYFWWEKNICLFSPSAAFIHHCCVELHAFACRAVVTAAWVSSCSTISTNNKTTVTNEIWSGQYGKFENPICSSNLGFYWKGCFLLMFRICSQTCCVVCYIISCQMYRKSHANTFCFRISVVIIVYSLTSVRLWIWLKQWSKGHEWRHHCTADSQDCLNYHY